MAEYAISFLVERVGDLLISEAKSLYGVRGQVEELGADLRRMQCFLRDADARRVNSEVIKNLVFEIREVASDAEDVLETFAVKINKRWRRGAGIRSILLRFACILNEGITFHNIGSDVKSIRAKISKHTTSLQGYGVIAVTEGGEGSIERPDQLRRSYSHFIEEDFVGFDKDIKILVNILVDEEKHRRAVSICGMGGLGKTTLAKKVFHHSNIRGHFDAFAWVSISRKWQKIDILQGILIKLIPSERRDILSMREEELVRRLYEIQQQKKCLVVLDDIWSIDAWDCLQPAFPLRNTGSKILFTTRNRTVAWHIDPNVWIHEPWCLNAEDSWKLLQMKALAGRNDSDPRVNTEMEKLGREMLRRCGGLPLAIVALGGLLATRHTLREWGMVHQSMDLCLGRNNDIEQVGGRVQQVLALSYNDLPCQLKACFLYLGHFLEDCSIKAETLYLLWIAEGMVFTKDRKCGETMLDVAERYLDELARRSMVQVELAHAKLSTPEVILESCFSPQSRMFESCRLHDLMRELILLERENEDFLKVIDFRSHGNEDSSSSTANNKTRRLAIYLGCSLELKYLRLFKLLRVLDFKGFDWKRRRVPEEIGDLIHLRYLSFNNCESPDKGLPSSIGNLQFLEILDLRLDEPIVIPNILWKLKRLRHLYLPRSAFPLAVEKVSLGGLSELETLENFDPRVFDVKDLFKLASLQNFGACVSVDCSSFSASIVNYLKRTSHKLRQVCLYISDLGRIEESLAGEMFGCEVLHKLGLRGRIVKLPEYGPNCFSKNLTVLALGTSGLKEDPMSTLEKILSLQSLLLYNAYEGEEMVCSAGGFPHLTSLNVTSLLELKNWRVDEGAMPKLSSLLIEQCKQLEMLPDGLRFLTALRELRIDNMPKAFQDSAQVVNGKEGKDFHKVRHVPCVSFDGPLY